MSGVAGLCAEPLRAVLMPLAAVPVSVEVTNFALAYQFWSSTRAIAISLM
jgi:hypothetical protein